MNKKYLINLIEIQNLDNQTCVHLKNIDSHRERITSIEQKQIEQTDLKQLKTKQLQTFNSSLSKLEAELFMVEKQIKKSKANLEVATNQQQLDASNKELQVMTPKASALETDVLEMYDKIELCQDEIAQIDTFLDGAATTLATITFEVEQDVKAEQLEIKELEQRIEALLEGCPKDIKIAFLQANEQYRFKNPLAFINEGTCNRCHYLIDKNIQNQVEKHFSLELCPNCARPLIALSITRTEAP
ncbi:MAG: hypothetical protein ISR65_12485 [Bacteriovoracaceae bacterium]|nr:hypothetical protein [Bacteriovoracaceae bacterium]